jgi:hypothetical protein
MPSDIAKIGSVGVKIDIKTIRDAGGGTITTATSGATVTFNRTFKDIRSITVTAARDDAQQPIAVYDFTDGPNPTTFTVFLYATKGTNSGNRITGSFYWSAEGV